MKQFWQVWLVVCLTCLPGLLAVSLLLYRKMRNSVGGDSASEWKLIHKTQDMAADRIEHKVDAILRCVDDNNDKLSGRTADEEQKP